MACSDWERLDWRCIAIERTFGFGDSRPRIRATWTRVVGPLTMQPCLHKLQLVVDTFIVMVSSPRRVLATATYYVSGHHDRPTISLHHRMSSALSTLLPHSPPIFHTCGLLKYKFVSSYFASSPPSLQILSLKFSLRSPSVTGIGFSPNTAVRFPSLVLGS